MNKKILLLALILLVPAFLSAQALSGWWTGGNLGFGYCESNDCSTNFLLDLDVLSFSFKHNMTGIMLTLTPFHMESFCEQSDYMQEKNNIESCINAKIGFDVLRENYDLDLTPYVSINWAPLDDISEYRAEAGLDFTWWAGIDIGYTYPFRVKVLSLKTACGMKRDEPYFTASCSIDLSVAAYVILWASMEDATEDDSY